MKGCYDLGKERQFLRLLSLTAPSDFKHCNRLNQSWRQQLHLWFLGIVLYNNNVQCALLGSDQNMKFLRIICEI